VANQQGEVVMERETSGWAAGWAAFAGFMMVLLGFGWLMVGLMAASEDEILSNAPEYLFDFTPSTWGWVHIALGIIVLVAGFYVFTGAVWARLVGVVVAIVAAIIAFAWLPYYPVWAVILIAVSVSIIWALTIHGRDLADVRGNLYQD
jgi:hypothetical protein